MICPFELYVNEEPAGDKCNDCFWWMHTKNKCIIQGSPEETKNTENSHTGVKQFLDRCGFPIGKVGYRNVLAALELLFSPDAHDCQDITGIYRTIGRETGRTISSIRQSIRGAIIWAWENGSLKEAFPKRVKRPRLIELFYHLQNQK